MTGRVMSLTPELVARCHRSVEDPGPSAGVPHLCDADYEDFADRLLAAYPVGAPIRLFAYGSLIWKPEIEHVEEQPATAAGWHRSFCIRLTRWRGSEQQPGLMMGLDRNGACRGMLYRLPDGDVRQQLIKLLRREMSFKPPTNMARWIRVSTLAGPMSALAFVVNRRGHAYCGKLSDEEIAAILARACGHIGSGADYLYHTVASLEARGIHDRYLWRLQHLVAAEIQPNDSAVATVAAG